MIQLPAKTSEIPSPVAMLADHAITDPKERPVRYFDPYCFPPGLDLRLCVAREDATDEEHERRLQRVKNPRIRNWLDFLTAPVNVFRSWGELRQARSIVCQAPHYFWLLLALWRLGIFSVRGKAIQTVFFRTAGFRRKLRLFVAAPPEFEAGFASREQIRQLEDLGMTPGRLRYVPWKIDTRWFTPSSASQSEAYILCPGDIRRDENLIRALIGNVPLKIIRVGRSPALKDIYASGAPLDKALFELRINASHPEYRSLLRGAALVVLPILPCDEPAGLTAALETLSCGRPLLANQSQGIGELLDECNLEEMVLVDGLEANAWQAAIQQALENPAPIATWLAARDLVSSGHSLF